MPVKKCMTAQILQARDSRRKRARIPGKGSYQYIHIAIQEYVGRIRQIKPGFFFFFFFFFSDCYNICYYNM